MAKYFRITIGTSLQTTFSVKYSTTSNPSTYDHIADIYIPSSGTFSTAASISYNQLTDNGGAIVRTDDDVYKLTIIDQNGYCSSCISEEFGTASSSGGSDPATTSNVEIYNYISNSNGSNFPIRYGQVLTTSGGTINTWNAGSDPTDGSGSGMATGVRNYSDDELYIRLKAFTYQGGTYYPDAIAEILYDGDGRNAPGGVKKALYIGTTGGSQNIYPGTGAMTSTSPQYSGGQYYWRLGPNKSIFFGIHPGYYTAISRNSAINYTLSFSTSSSVTSTQTTITRYVP